VVVILIHVKFRFFRLFLDLSWDLNLKKVRKINHIEGCSFNPYFCPILIYVIKMVFVVFGVK
jgi:hypothetical protein